MSDGGSGQPDSSLPSNKSIENTVANTPESNITQAEETPFAQPPSGTADVNVGANDIPNSVAQGIA